MKHSLNITTILILCGSMAQAHAQSPAACIPTPSCTSLGYTSTSSCTGGLKCPFGNYWNCDAMNKIAELEEKIKNYQLGLTDCMVGTILYSDKTCSNILVTGKTPIGIVVYDDGQGHRQAIALERNGGGFFKSSYRTVPARQCKIIKPSLTNFSFMATEAEALNDYDSCGNTAKLVAASSDFTAANNIHSYSTRGTSAGDWCLPAAGILKSISENYQAIRNSLNLVGGDELTCSLSSNMKDNYNYWYMSSVESGNLSVGTDYNDDAASIYETNNCYFSCTLARPVLEF